MSVIKKRWQVPTLNNKQANAWSKLQHLSPRIVFPLCQASCVYMTKPNYEAKLFRVPTVIQDEMNARARGSRQFLLFSSVEQSTLSMRSCPELQSTAVDEDQAIADDVVRG